MINLKSEKGSITVFVLASCMFFITAVTCMQMYMQSKQIAVDREYRQIKANYEKDISNIEEIYDKLKMKNELEVSFSDIKIDEDTKNISLKATLDTQDIDINTLKYGWLYKEQKIEGQNIEESIVNQIDRWYFVENANGKTNINSMYKYTEDEGYGYYYFCFVVNNKINYKRIAYLHQVEYIESTGTQWIDTRWAPTVDAGIEFDIQLTENEKTRQDGHGVCFFSTSHSENSEDYTFRANIGEKSFEYNMIFYWVDKKYAKGGLIRCQRDTNMTQRSIMSVKSNNAVFQGVETSIATRTVSNQSNLALLANLEGGNMMDRYNVKIYSCKLYEGDDLIKHLVPAVDTDGSPCLYDILEYDVYNNQGTGQFQYAE